MPKIAKELTVLEIKRLGHGTFAIGGVKGLYIRKTPTQTFFYPALQRRHRKARLFLGLIPRNERRCGEEGCA